MGRKKLDKHEHKVHCRFCGKMIDPDNCYYKKDGTPVNLCKDPCNKEEAYVKRWKKKPSDEIQAEIKRLLKRVNCLNGVLLRRWKAQHNKLKGGDK